MENGYIVITYGNHSFVLVNWLSSLFLRACLHGVGDPGLVGLHGFFCFHALGDTKQKKLTPLDRGPPLHVNRVLLLHCSKISVWGGEIIIVCVDQIV